MMDVPNRPTDDPPVPDAADAEDRRRAGLLPGAADAEIPPQDAHDAPPVPGANPPNTDPEPTTPEETPPSPS